MSKMSQLYIRLLCGNLAKARPGFSGLLAHRSFATETKLEDYGAYPDPLEQATGLEKKIMLARLAGDDRYEVKIFYRGEHSSRDYPNLVPAHYDDKIVLCLCDPESNHGNLMMIRKGSPKRCECGHWFKAVDADPDSF